MRHANVHEGMGVRTIDERRVPFALHTVTRALGRRQTRASTVAQRTSHCCTTFMDRMQHARHHPLGATMLRLTRLSIVSWALGPFKSRVDGGQAGLPECTFARMVAQADVVTRSAPERLVFSRLFRCQHRTSL